MRKIITKTVLAALGLGICLPMYAETHEFVYSSPTEKRVNYGYLNFAGHYDVATFIPGEEYSKAGAKVTKLEMEVTLHEKISNYRMWMASNLTDPGEDVEFEGSFLNVKVTPEVTNDDGTRGKISYELEEPVKLPEEGIYVGYSFDVAELTADYDTKRPLMFTTENNGCKVYSRLLGAYTSAWQYVEGASTPYVVTMTADNFPKDLATFEGSKYLLNVGQGVDVVVKAVNMGITEIEKINYTYTLNGVEETGFSRSNIPGRIGAFHEITIKVDPFTTPGVYPMTFKLTGLNGQENPLADQECVVEIEVLGDFPQKRPVMEEYTGTWCGWCTRGMIGMEVCRERIPGFIGIAYHGGDPMEMKAGSPNQASGYPKAIIDRVVVTDPYFGTTNQNAGIIDDYNARAEELSPADITVEAKWNDEEDVLHVKSTVNFWAEPQVENPYRIAYIVVEDGLSGTSSGWNQTNYYAEGAGTATGDLAVLPSMGSPIKNLKFNDVAVYTSGHRGISGSVPALDKIERGIDYVHEYDIPEADFVSKDGLPTWQNKGKQRIIAMLLCLEGTYCRVENAAMDLVYNRDSIDELQSSEACVRNIDYYDLAGRKIANPAKGIYVRVVTYTDGTSESDKIVLR